MLCVYGLSKGYNNLENSGNDKGDDQKRQYLHAVNSTTTTTTLLHLQYYGKFELNQKIHVNAHCQSSLSQAVIWVLSWNF